MDSLKLAISVVTPLMVYLIVGILVQKFQIMSRENLKALNVMIFRVLIALALFFDVYRSDLKQSFQVRMFLYVFLFLAALIAFLWITVSKTVKDPAAATVMIQGMFRSNYVLYGGLLAASISGDAGAALAASLCVMVVPMFNIMAVILFETRRGGSVKAKDVIISIFKNPLVDAALAGMILNFLNIPLPELLASPLQKLGSIATPLALVVLGGSLSFGSLVRHKKYLTVTVLARLLLIPVAALTGAILLGMRNEQLAVILAIFGSPTAVASVPMTYAMGGDGELAGEIVVTTTLFSILSVFILVFLLSFLGYIPAGV